MRKAWIYVVILFAFEMALGLVYGFFLQSAVSVAIFIFISFSVPFLVLFIFKRTEKDRVVRLIETLILSFLLMAVFVMVFWGGNQLGGDLVGEYDVTVEFVNGRGGGTAYFTTPSGEEGSVGLNDYRIIVEDDDCISVGDTIRVREYKGFFNQFYYALAEKTQ